MLEEGVAVDLVFSDLVMPGGLTGHDVARRAPEINPATRILLTSGYAEDLARSGSLAEIRLLRKPYRLNDLREAIKETLASQP
jgi:two-component SAPR family response regulator